MQNAINQFFAQIFQILNEFLANFMSDPGSIWGWSIVLFTLIFYTIFMPLNWRSMRSTQKMSKIQPELKRIQEYYKNDPMALQKAQQKFMKDNKVSMLGGCLPMLIQWPFFIALFYTFNQLAKEGKITGKGFLGPLVPDLGATGNIVLTVLSVLSMIASTIYMQKSNESKMTAEAKAQQKNMNTMNYVMSLMIGWFTYSAPAALGLYWVVGNLFRILQQFLMNRLKGEDDEIIPADIPYEKPAKVRRNKVVRK